jgi:dolichyl-phosphate beta-glucosyltransferase
MIKMEISIVIPSYNEEKRIGKTLEKVQSFLNKENYDYEILVVNDGSKDKTEEIVKDFSEKNSRIKLVNNPGNKGKGYTVKNGMTAAKKEWVLFSDADLSTPIGELRKFKKYTKNYDIIFGSRAMKESHIVVKQPWYRRLPGKIFPILVQLLVLRGIKDTQCGFKMFRKKYVNEILARQTIDGFAFDAELLFIAKQLGLKLKEVPVIWKNDMDSKLDPIKNSITMFLELLQVRMNAFKGKYK